MLNVNLVLFCFYLVQASLGANTFAVVGQAETKSKSTCTTLFICHFNIAFNLTYGENLHPYLAKCILSKVNLSQCGQHSSLMPHAICGAVVGARVMPCDYHCNFKLTFLLTKLMLHYAIPFFFP